MPRSLLLLRRICVLRAGGVEMPIAGAKAQAILTWLALNPGPQPRESLAALLWGASDAAHATHSLNQCVHELRRALGDETRGVLAAQGDSLALCREGLLVDVVEFEAAAAEGSPVGLERACALYCSDLLGALRTRSEDFDAWLVGERLRLRELACGALVRVAESRWRAGDIDAAGAFARRILSVDSAREDAHRMLMRVHAARGERETALRVFTLCRETLQRELNVDPEEETILLYEKIRRGRPRAVPAERLLERPLVTVRPFAGFGEGSAAAEFARGLEEDVASALHRWTWFELQIGPAANGAAELTVADSRAQYALDGVARLVGSRVRVTLQLLDGASGGQIWAERWDRPSSDVLAVQDEIATLAAGAIESELLRREAELGRAGSGEGVDPWGLFRAGMWHFHRFTAEDSDLAVEALRRAVELRPGLAVAHAGLARALLARTRHGWARRADAEAEIERAVVRAMELDPRDPYPRHALAGSCLLRRDLAGALAVAAEVTVANPSFALGRFRVGQALLALGRFDEAATAVEAGLKLDPRDGQTGFWLALLAFAHYLAGRHATAAECARAAIRRRASPGAFLALAAANGHLCRPAEAAAALAKYRVLAVRRPAVAGCSPFVSLNDAKRVVEGLEKVGLSCGGAASQSRRCSSNAAAEWWTERGKERAHPLAPTLEPVAIGPPDAGRRRASRLST